MPHKKDLLSTRKKNITKHPYVIFFFLAKKPYVMFFLLVKRTSQIIDSDNKIKNITLEQIMPEFFEVQAMINDNWISYSIVQYYNTISELKLL